MNALPNYSYAVLESQVRTSIAGVGLDPSIGFLHVCQPGRDSFVYDLMEPYRPDVDREVVTFVRSQSFTPRDFVIDVKWVCRLHPQLARHIVDHVGRDLGKVIMATEDVRATLLGSLGHLACERNGGSNTESGLESVIRSPQANEGINA